MIFAFCSSIIWLMGFNKRQAARDPKESQDNGYLPRGGMHPPSFLPSQHLLDWPKCRLEMRCGCCGSVVLFPAKLLAERHGKQTFAEFLAG